MNEIFLSLTNNVAFENYKDLLLYLIIFYNAGRIILDAKVLKIEQDLNKKIDEKIDRAEEKLEKRIDKETDEIIKNIHEK